MERIEADCPKGCGKKAVRLKGQYGFFWKCECFDGTFKDVDGKPVIKEERPKAKCPVKGCKGTAQQFQRKDGSGAFWKCTTCSNMFNDENGKPVIKDKPKDNKDKPKGK